MGKKGTPHRKFSKEEKVKYVRLHLAEHVSLLQIEREHGIGNLADWNKYGKSAGPKRNKQMAEAGDYVICFWDGKSRGTKSMIEFARECNKPVKIKKI